MLPFSAVVVRCKPAVVAEQLLTQDQMLLLLDGFDEVRETDSHRVLQSIRNFAAQFHLNHFVIACRIAD